MRILLTGSSGQLGQALRASLPARLAGEPVELIATARQPDPAQGVIGLDLADPEACRAAIASRKPDWVLNAGAYTAVDRAEAEPALAQAVNAGAPRAFAEALAEIGGRLLQVSTDFVFSGEQSHPYRPGDPRNPVNAYGASKAAGEQAVADALGTGLQGRATILRTSWVYGPVGRNFLLTMLRLHQQKAASGEPLGVVADQVGCPTNTAGLACACWAAIEHRATGILHWSDAGVASWYDFAVAIGARSEATGLLDRAAAVEPIRTTDYPTPARRPSYSLLDGTATRAQLNLAPRHWRQALNDILLHNHDSLQDLIQAAKA
ncbi:MAG: dTDP-4-dehydrorhamnose reductase [Synechococcus sp.]